jgi:hypothetical protein
MDFKQKYLKYKQKYLNLKNLQGGFLPPNDAFKFIESIGFEFETRQISPFIGTIKGNTLTLRPFGYNPTKLIDASDNPSMKRITIKDNFILTQDSYSDNKKENDITYKMTTYLSQYRKIVYNIINNDETIMEMKIKFNVENETHTIGHSEFLMTYFSVDQSQNIIMEKTYETLLKIQDFLETCKYYGIVEIDGKSHKIFNISVNETNIYFFKWYFEGNVEIKNKMNNDTLDNIVFSPQITIGVKLENYVSVYNHLISTNSDLNKIRDVVVYNLENIFKITNTEDNKDKYNFLFLLFNFINTIYINKKYNTNISDIFNIDEKTGEITIIREIYKIMPRQFFTEILKNNSILNEKYQQIITNTLLMSLISTYLLNIIIKNDNKIQQISHKFNIIFTKYNIEEKIQFLLTNIEEKEKQKLIIKKYILSTLTKLDTLINVKFGGTKIPLSDANIVYVELRHILSTLNMMDNKRTISELIKYVEKIIPTPIKEVQLMDTSEDLQNTKPLQNSLKRKRDGEDNDEQ